MTFTYDFELDEAENVRGCRFVVNRQRSVRIMYWFFPVMGLLGIGNILIGQPGGPLMSLVLVVASVAGPAALYWTPRTTVRNLRKNNRAAGGPHTYVFDGTGLDAKGTGATTTLQWANIPEAVENKEFFFFYVSKGWAILLPKKAIKPDELPAFRSAVRVWMGEKAHLLPSVQGA